MLIFPILASYTDFGKLVVTYPFRQFFHVLPFSHQRLQLSSLQPLAIARIAGTHPISRTGGAQHRIHILLVFLPVIFLPDLPQGF